MTAARLQADRRKWWRGRCKLRINQGHQCQRETGRQKRRQRILEVASLLPSLRRSPPTVWLRLRFHLSELAQNCGIAKIAGGCSHAGAPQLEFDYSLKAAMFMIRSRWRRKADVARC